MKRFSVTMKTHTGDITLAVLDNTVRQLDKTGEYITHYVDFDAAMRYVQDIIVVIQNDMDGLFIEGYEESLFFDPWRWPN